MQRHFYSDSSDLKELEKVAVDIMDERVDSGLGMQDVLTIKERIEQSILFFHE